MKTVILSYLVSILLFWGCSCSTAPNENDKKIEQKMKLLWEISYDFIGLAINSTPFLLGDSLVIMSAGKDLLAVEQQSGSIRWRTLISNETNIQTDCFQSDGLRLYGTHVEDIRSYKIVDGSLAWITTLSNERGGFWSNSPMLVGERLFVSGYRTVYCLDRTTGSILWSKGIQSRGTIGNPIFFDGKIVVGGSYGYDDSNGNLIGVIAKFYCLNAENGDTVWTTKMLGDGGAVDIVSDSLAVYGGSHFCYSSSSFEAIDLKTGQRKWSYYTPNEGWDYNHAIIVEDKIIANAGPYHVCAFNKNTGQLLWRTFIANDAESRKLHYYNGYVYHTQGWKLFVIDPNSGKIVYSMKGPQGQDIVTIAVGNDRVFVQGYPSLQCYEAYKP